MSELLVKIPVARIEQKIHEIRGERVILDSDLADIHGIATKRFNEQVRRNSERFPDDFMCRLTSCDLKNRPRRPTIFTIYFH